MDRYPAYALEVDQALASGQRVAIVGELPPGERNDADWYPFHAAGLKVETVADWYYVVFDPSPAFLERMGFKLNGAAFSADRDQLCNVNHPKTTMSQASCASREATSFHDLRIPLVALP
jgi:hypothetical protein